MHEETERDFGCGRLYRLSRGGLASTYAFVRPADHPRGVVEHAYPSHSIVFTDAGDWRYHGRLPISRIDEGVVVAGVAAGHYECSHGAGMPNRCFVVAIDTGAFDDEHRIFADPLVARSREMVLHRRAIQGASDDPDRLESLAFSLFEIVSRSSTGAGETARPDVRMEYAKRLVGERFAQRVSIAEIARELDLSRFTFTRRFRAHAGVSPYAYLTRMRVERAKGALRLSRDSIQEIALTHGFGSIAHFSSAFRRIVGCAPTTYRRENIA
ncbi:MAG TPA: AraC family transcriptional regulator [Candidatus Acidoferrales bacterium]|nr:AraC family transcriptional regulator [Candidatus Acidoferrales bacterium]